MESSSGPAGRAATRQRRFDAVIIGAGQAGPPLAGRLGQAGMSVAIIERSAVGGTCVNTGCTPTKTMVASAYAARTARRGADFGFSAGDVVVDGKSVAARSRRVVLDSRNSIERSLAGMKGVELIRGDAKLTSPTSSIALGNDTA